MKKQDNIVDLFRKNQHKLNERPSPQAWKKLERRLDQKNRGGKRPSASIYRLFMMMAAAIALVFFVVTLANMAEKNANLQAVVIPETIPNEVATNSTVSAEQAFRNKHQELLTQSIEEGSTDRLLLTKKPVRPFLIPKRS